MLIHMEENARLAALFDARAGVSQRQFGRIHGIGSGPMVWQYLHGARPLGLKAACQFAKGLNVPLAQISPRLAEELAELNGSSIQAPVLQHSDYDNVPCVQLKLRKGILKFEIEEVEHTAVYIGFRRDWMATKNYRLENLLAVRVPDDGMKGALAAGDLVVVNTDDTAFKEGEVFVLNYEGELRIRRMFRDVGKWWLHSDNQDESRHPRRRFFEKQCFSIGRVVHKQSETI